MLQSLKALQFDTDMVLSTSAPQPGDHISGCGRGMRMNLETGKLYFQSEALSGMMGAEQTDSWYLMNLKSTMDGLYGSGYYQELMALAYQENDGGFGEALRCRSGSSLPPARI